MIATIQLTLGTRPEGIASKVNHDAIAHMGGWIRNDNPQMAVRAKKQRVPDL
jgi:hypothetical protein